jgi:eukaryotic-like serine/threonine-protein kinase
MKAGPVDASAWREVRRAFDELVELEPGQREERLAALGATDPTRRRMVEALLRADADADARLDGLNRALVPPESRARDPLGLNGRAVAHFRVLEPLGSGGMGVVYAAEDLRLDRVVALKLPLPTQRLDSSGRARFLQEARSAGGLDHPNICSVYEVGETEEGQLFLAMARYQGETLRARIAREGASPVGEAVAVARQIARGLAAAHQAGIVHRDLKPANVMLPPDGVLKILDFGLAKVRDLSLSGSGRMLGTAAYMAPEQIRGAPVDGRTDLWSLGVVLYEMLTGRQPFRGEHEISIAHAIAHTEPVPPSRLRSGIPPRLEDLVLALLAKAPADRPATAELVEAELAEVERGRRAGVTAAARRWLREPGHRRALGAAGLGCALAAGYAVFRPPPTRNEPNLLAVAPFEVSDSSLQLWREGLVDILSLDLDGAGPLRTVPQTTVLRRWSGRADRASAAGLGSRTGAELVVFGQVLRLGRDSVGIRARLLDRPRGVMLAELEVVGEERRMGSLADSLGVQVLRTLGRTRPIGSVRHVSIGARSLPALKQYLQGEQFYRRAAWDSALAYYDRAVAEDSTFALALRRMSLARSWDARTTLPYLSPGEYLRRAVAWNRGLPPRDSVLLTEAAIDTDGAPTADELVTLWYRKAALLGGLARRYPDDPEVWFMLGEHRFHAPPPLGQLPGPALDPFERASALDPGFAPADLHLVELAMRLGRVDEAKAHARVYVARDEGGLAVLRLVSLIFDSGGVEAPRVRREVEAADEHTLMFAGEGLLRWWTDSAETAVVLLRELASRRDRSADRPPDPPDAVPTAMSRQRLAAALAFRGHLRAAVEAGEPPRAGVLPGRWRQDVEDPFQDLALLGFVPDSVTRRVYGHALGSDSAWSGNGSARPPRHLLGLPWWLTRGDSASIVRFGNRAAQVARSGGPAIAVLRARYYGQAAPAYLALLQGDSADAVRRLEAIPDTLCLVGGCFLERVLLARLLAARGEDRRAADMLDRWAAVGDARPLVVLAALDRARLAERMGDRSKARERYRFVTEVWRDPDPELRPHLSEARAGLARLAP